MEEKNETSRVFLVLLIVATIIGVTGFVYWSFQKSTESQKPLYTQLLEKNDEFASGEGLFNSGKYDEAATQFRLALEKAEDYKEEGQLKYKIAQAESSGSNPIGGIALFKEVAANENYTPVIRAYAVQSMGNLIYSYNTSEIKNEIFKDEPYASFLAEGDDTLARRKLFEYASAFYPLGISELRIAKWYSTEILKLTESGRTDEETKNNIEEMKMIVRQNLANADTFLLDITNDVQSRHQVAEVWHRKGAVLGDLFLSSDTTFPNPEEAYKQALAFSTIRVGNESAAKYSYAVFLAKMYGEERADDIKKLLNDFYTSSKYKGNNMERMIRNEKNNLLGNRDDILLLAKIDNQFEAYLKTLGWVI